METESAYSSLTLKKTSTNSSKQQSYCFLEPLCVRTQVSNSTSKFCLGYIFTKATFLMCMSIKRTYGHFGHLQLNFWHPHLEEKRSTLRHLPQETRALHKYLSQHPFNMISNRKRTSLKQHLLKHIQLRQPELTPPSASLKLTTRAVPSPAAHLPHTKSMKAQLTLAETHKQHLMLNI